MATLDGSINMRISAKSLETFQSKCIAMGRPGYHTVIREMMEAFNEGRLTITPTKEHKELYNDN